MKTVESDEGATTAVETTIEGTSMEGFFFFFFGGISFSVLIAKVFCDSLFELGVGDNTLVLLASVDAL